jgi:hypothetical protein
MKTTLAVLMALFGMTEVDATQASSMMQRKFETLQPTLVQAQDDEAEQDEGDNDDGEDDDEESLIETAGEDNTKKPFHLALQMTGNR